MNLRIFKYEYKNISWNICKYKFKNMHILVQNCLDRFLNLIPISVNTNQALKYFNFWIDRHTWSQGFRYFNTIDVYLLKWLKRTVLVVIRLLLVRWWFLWFSTQFMLIELLYSLFTYLLFFILLFIVYFFNTPENHKFLTGPYYQST